MRRLCFAIALMAFPVFAEEKAKPNKLTPKEIAEGWILLFDGETTFGWKVEGEAKVEAGMLHLGGGENRASLTTRVKFAAFDLRLETAKGSGAGEFVLDTGTSKSVTGLPAQPTRLTATVCPAKGFGSTGETSVGSDGIAEIKASETIGAPVQIAIVALPGHKVILHSASLRPTDSTSIFNGKDLTGWKEFKPAKDKKVASKFTVTKEGWLNVKDGPGDLQTESQWADFVVQLECISNGKHLNSGLFFRCIPGQYQQGYEAQIRNQWEGDDRTKPVDFGTGAIYRRQKARKVVSTDGEWFTMTVAAHGRHIATWVNGYQVTDWTDDRKEDDNARNGFKKGKGALSIQGHDPTTDLSFRNIRIQPLDPK
jgi:3-keto-disaccharide hydrolase